MRIDNYSIFISTHKYLYISLLSRKYNVKIEAKAFFMLQNRPTTVLFQ